MKIKLEIGPDCDVKVENDDQGNPVAIELTPVFTKKNGQVVVAFGVSKTDGGKQLDRFALSVSGATGKVSKTDRKEPVKAAVDEGDKPAAPPADPTNKGST